MTISIWRYSHLILALASSLFLFIAAVTGCVLAIEPMQHQAKGFAVRDLDEVSLATTIVALKSAYDEVFSLEVEASGFVKASVLTTEMETLDIFVDAMTGEELAHVQERHFIYSFATNLHRSLFLKSIGRFFVGLISLLLFLIALTGFLLLAKRQGGIKGLFTKVQKDYFEVRYHVILSRWFFVPILILAVTGVYLSAEKFELLPEVKIAHQQTKASNEIQKFSTIEDIPFFKETSLSQVRKVEFPFSEAPEDYYQIDLKDREIRVNQQSGRIISSAQYPFVQLASRLSWALHTGEGSVVWSIVLLLASASILFFIYSGFAMTLNRWGKVTGISVMPDKDESEFVILVGSETGTTFDFAKRLYNSLTAEGKNVYLTELNTYSTYSKAKHIFIFTATYGEGDPPTNARKFEAAFTTIQQPNTINYAVVGFGSLEYPDYCKFAIQVDALVQSNPNFLPLIPLYKINNAAFAEFEHWVKEMRQRLGLTLTISTPKVKNPKLKKTSFLVLERTELNVDDTFLIRLKAKSKVKFTSGDLLSIFPPETDIARQYSIAKMGNELLLSVKKHTFGRGSSYLFRLNKGDTIQAHMDTNAHFHFPKQAPSTVLIANGTGIAPFLGMMAEHRDTNINLFWGGRTKVSIDIYDDILDDIVSKNPKISIHKSFSREESKQYVQELISQHKNIVLKTIEAGGVIMLCGSLAMQHDVLDRLEKLLTEHNTIGLEELRHNGQLRMDCY